MWLLLTLNAFRVQANLGNLEKEAFLNKVRESQGKTIFVGKVKQKLMKIFLLFVIRFHS